MKKKIRHFGQHPGDPDLYELFIEDNGDKVELENLQMQLILDDFECEFVNDNRLIAMYEGNYMSASYKWKQCHEEGWEYSSK